MTPSNAKVHRQEPLFQEEKTKICKTCSRNLPFTEFEKANHGTSWRGSCHNCRTAKRKEQVKRQSIPLSKICRKCGAEKSADEFTKWSTGRSGLFPYCKDCKRANERLRATKKAEEKREALRVEYDRLDASSRPSAKICGNPKCRFSGQIQPPENFDKSKIHPSGLRVDCRICELERKRSLNPEESSKEYHSRWYQEHRQELALRVKEWRESNPEEVRRLYVTRRFRQYGVTEEWYEEQLKAQGGCCAICGSSNPGNMYGTFHVDHNHSCCSKSCHACDKCRRGLLCSVCNTRLAYIENKEWAKKAKAYLARFPLKNPKEPNVPSLFDGI